MKKSLTLIVAALCLCAFVNKANAQFSGGDGSENNPYIFTTAAQLAQFSTYFVGFEPPSEYYQYYDKYYKLDNDIDLSAYQSGKGWIPIGENLYFNPFRGDFNGNNKKITGLTINDPSLSGVGFFGYIYGGSVYDLGIENATINGKSSVGGVVGAADTGSTITNCYSTGKISGGGTYVGGVVGQITGTTITNCYSTSEVSGGRNLVSSCTAGVVGSVYGGGCSITNCYSTGKVTGDGGEVGGVAGNIGYLGKISNCYFTGEVNGDDYVGGVVGNANSGTATNCYSTGKVNGKNYVGGVVGRAGDNVTTCYSTGNVSGREDVGGVVGSLFGGSELSNCYSTSPVTGNSSVGGVVGSVNHSYVKNCYATGEVTGNAASGGVAGLILNSGTVSFCVALNPGVIGMTIENGRVAGNKSILSGLFGNAAWDGIKDIYGVTTNWQYKGANNFDGEDMTFQTIQSDGTLGNRFTAANGWTTQNGKLPGLFGNTVEMPTHLGGVGIDEWRVESGEWRVFPNPTRGELTIVYPTSDNPISDIEIFDVMGRNVGAYGIRPKIGQSEIGQSEIVLDVSHLANGVYFLRITTENSVVTRKIVKQ